MIVIDLLLVSLTFNFQKLNVHLLNLQIFQFTLILYFSAFYNDTIDIETYWACNKFCLNHPLHFRCITIKEFNGLYLYFVLNFFFKIILLCFSTKNIIRNILAVMYK